MRTHAPQNVAGPSCILCWRGTLKRTELKALELATDSQISRCKEWISEGSIVNGKVTQAVDGEKARQSGWGRGISAISRD